MLFLNNDENNVVDFVSPFVDDAPSLGIRLVVESEFFDIVAYSCKIGERIGRIK